MAAAMPVPRQVHYLAERVQLELLGRCVAHPHRTRSPPALQVQLALDQAALAADAVGDPQVLGVPGGGALHEAAEAVGLVLEPELGERPAGEHRVADPR